MSASRFKCKCGAEFETHAENSKLCIEVIQAVCPVCGRVCVRKGSNDRDSEAGSRKDI